MKYLVYARMSERGSGYAAEEKSVETQADVCRQYAALHEGEVVGAPVVDVFLSGASLKRAGLGRVLAELRAGPVPWDALIVWRLDRLTRSVKDFLHLVEVFQQHGKALVSVSESLDLATPAGRMLATSLVTVAAYFRETSADATKMKMLAIARSGRWPIGRVPWGYQRPGAHQNALVVDPVRGPRLQALFADYAAGRATVRELGAREGLGLTTVAGLLRNPMYRGVVAYEGCEYPGQHPALVDGATWAAVQARLPQRRPGPRPGAQVYPYTLTGLLFCPHGAALTPATAYGRGARPHYYYRPVGRCGCKALKARDAEAAVLRAVLAAPFDHAALADYVARVRELRDERARALAPQSATLTAERQRLAADVATIEGLFLRGLVEPDNAPSFNARLRQARAALLSCDERIRDAAALLGPDLGLFADVETLAAHLSELAAAARAALADPLAARRFLAVSVERIEVVGDDLRIAPLLSGSSNQPKWWPILYFVEPWRRVVGG